MASDDAVLVLNNADDVAVARRKLLPGEILSVGDARIPVLDVIPLGHKIALHDVAEAEPVTKYGYQIGVALQPIKAGQHVHVHNLVFSSHHKPKASDLDHHAWTPPATPERTTFMGVRRNDGTTATRNYIAVLSTVKVNAAVARLERPYSSIAMAYTLCSPSAKTAPSHVHGSVEVPALTVQYRAPSTYTLTVLPSSAVPLMAGVAVPITAPLAGAVMLGAAGGVVSIAKVIVALGSLGPEPASAVTYTL